eukprot:9541034-Alexandrium_andersonii.AAC.1
MPEVGLSAGEGRGARRRHMPGLVAVVVLGRGLRHGELGSAVTPSSIVRLTRPGVQSGMRFGV